MDGFHHKYGQCEQCGSSIEDVGALQAVNFWFEKESRRIPYYLYVCDGCFTNKNTWCKTSFPDNCEWCNASIEDAEHYLSKKVNAINQSIQTYGLAPE